MTTITVTIQKHSYCRYMSVTECIRSNAERHRLNGERHLAEGRPDYAEGSFLKAFKNHWLARSFERLGYQ